MKFLAGLALLILSTLPAMSAQADSSTGTPDFADLYEQHAASVVTIHTGTVTNNNGTPRAQRGVGSGFIIENDSVLTAAHVVDDATVIQVHFTDGRQIRADVVASLESSDVALLKLRRPHPDPTLAVLGDSDNTRIGSKVFIIGSPFGISQTLSVGHLSGRMDRGEHADGTAIEFLQTDTAINTGNSGGPMFNTDGEVIGIVSFILTKGGGFDGIGFATASNTAQQALKQSSGVLAGFEGIRLSKRLAKLLNFPGPGMLVQRVVEDSIVDEAGLRAGNVPVQVGNQTLLLGGDYILDIDILDVDAKEAAEHELIHVSTKTVSKTDPKQTKTLKHERNDEWNGLHHTAPKFDKDAYVFSVFREGEIIELTTAEPEILDAGDDMPQWDYLYSAGVTTSYPHP